MLEACHAESFEWLVKFVKRLTEYLGYMGSVENVGVGTFGS